MTSLSRFGSPSPAIPSTPSATEASPTRSSEPSPTASPLLAEGRSFGYIHSVDIPGHQLVFDLAQFFTGPAADRAAVEDGVIGSGERVPNDYYSRNVNPILRTVPFASDVELRIIDWNHCCDLTTGDLDAFAKAFAAGAQLDVSYHGPHSPYWLTVTHGTIVNIEEQYVP